MNSARNNSLQPQPGASLGARPRPLCGPVSRKTHTTARVKKILVQFSPPILQTLRVRILPAILFVSLLGIAISRAQDGSRLIEAAGSVEYFSTSQTNWLAATNGLALRDGDKVRTRAHSRAAVQLSDRSVVRLDELTTLEILPPRNAEKKRFGLPRGSVYFFNREKPSDVEFDTPLAAGAIRGTEFLLEANDASGVHLALIDGLVSLKSAAEEVSLQRGEEVRLESGKPAQKTALVNATAKIQWALYYPGIVAPEELTLTAGEQSALAEVLKYYRAGDLLAALAAWPESSKPETDSAKTLRAQLELAVGRVSEAEALLNNVNATPALALRELISVVRGEKAESPEAATSASVQLAHSYALQSQANLPAARAAAKRAAELAPDFGFVHERFAELEFAFGNRNAALAELKLAYQFSPRLAAAYALQGFTLLEQGEPKIALTHFDRAREIDAALGSAWLGRGLCLLKLGKFSEARAAFQAAAALEPQRSLFRSYLGKAASEMGDAKLAEKEFRLAKELDGNDPTPWLYSALHLWQENKLNAAIRDLETSYDKNDNRAAFRSRELLDEDKSVRSANLAVIYDDAGLTEVSRHIAARAVTENYANFSGHLFLANSYQTEQDLNRFDLRLETARQSELLTANLLAPPGAGNLSQVLSQSDRLRFFDQKPFGVSSLTGYGSRGDWSETATIFGTVNDFSYAFDTVYQSLNGQRANNESEQRNFAFTVKQRVTDDDELYFQIGDFHSEAGDVQPLFDPNTAARDFSVREKQAPNVYAGWHRAWSPRSHTLFLFSRLQDDFTQHNGNADVLYLQTPFFGSGVLAVANGPLTPAPSGSGPLTTELNSRFTLYSADIQHIWETEKFSLIAGGRWQSGSADTDTRLIEANNGFPVTSLAQNESGQLNRGDAYAYGSWQMTSKLRVISGVSYTHLEYPRNLDLPPISALETERNLVSPKVGLLFEPWERGLIRAAWTRSLGGLYFDNSVRLEPTLVGGFNQAYRSLLPESVAGLVPGSRFETVSLGFDQSLKSGTFFGIETEQLTSKGERDAGSFSSFGGLLIDPGTVSQTRQQLDFRERNLSVYAAQLWGDFFSVSTRYRLSEAKLTTEFPDIPDTAAGLDQLEQRDRAVLHTVSLALNFYHPCGVFAQWESDWYHQNNFGYMPSLAAEDMWQHNVMVGYRFARRHAEIRAGILNITDENYRLNPLNLVADLPRGRTFAVNLRLNF